MKFDLNNCCSRCSCCFIEIGKFYHVFWKIMKMIGSCNSRPTTATTEGGGELHGFYKPQILRRWSSVAGSCRKVQEGGGEIWMTSSSRTVELFYLLQYLSAKKEINNINNINNHP